MTLISPGVSLDTVFLPYYFILSSYCTMIDAILFRYRIGLHNPARAPKSVKSRLNKCRSYIQQQENLSHNITKAVGPLAYLILLIYMGAVMLALQSSVKESISAAQQAQISFFAEYDDMTVGNGGRGPKIFLFSPLVVLLTAVVYRINCTNDRHEITIMKKLYYQLRFSYSPKANLLYRCFRKYIVWLVTFNAILLTYSNMSLLNPGPNGLSIMYQNVRGLIPVSDVNNKHPNLNYTKLNELQSYIHTSSPDILILNETWLKPSIHDNEILSPDLYKIFRRDRSHISHPPDPTNSSRFRSGGGGVLIAVKTDLEVVSKEINLKCRAEVIATEITFSNNTKICIATCYRVGTLGTQNFKELESYFTNLITTKKIH